MTTSNQKPLPIFEVRNGSVKAAIWENVTDKGTFLNVTTARVYRNENGEWKNASSYTEFEIDALVDSLLDAKEWMRQRRQSSSKAA